MYFLPCIVLDIFLGLERITLVLILDLSITFKATISSKSYSPAIELSFKSIFSSFSNSIFANKCAFLFFCYYEGYAKAQSKAMTIAVGMNIREKMFRDGFT
jgi:hypothetical protein